MGKLLIQDMEITYEVTAEDMRLSEGILTIPAQEIRKEVEEYGKTVAR